jgi:beta-lactamase regulating signal transducer with metallopeptidase domain
MSADLFALLSRGLLAASAAILVVLALRAPVRAAFGARVAYALWLIVPVITAASYLPARRIVVDTFAQASVPVATGLQAAPAVVGPAFAPPLDAIAATWSATPFLLAFWLAGFAASLALLLFGQQRFLSRLGLRRGADGLHVAVNDAAGPAVIGIVAPRIVVPADFEVRYTETERALVLEHERAHIRAGDVQVNALAALAQCVMWFNPLAYIARAALRIDQELACDERVMQRHANARRTYAEAMLKTQLAASAIPLGCAWPPIGAQPLKQRIAMLARPHVAAPRRAAGAAFCALVIGAAGVAAWVLQPPRVAYAEVYSGSDRDDDRDSDTNVLNRGAGARLVQALMDGDAAEVRALIAAGADVNHWTPGDGTPLIMAARLNDAALAQTLLAAGADVNQPARGEGNALIVAAAEGYLDLVRLFVETGADVNAIVRGDETPLINAAREGHVEIARYLIERGADVNLAVDAPTTRGVERRSPLSMAMRGGHADVVRTLRAAGARD